MALSITKELESTLGLAFAEAKARRHEHVVLEHAAMQVQSSGKEQIDGGNVLVAFYRERDSHAVYLLERQGITRLDLLRYISHGALKVRDPSAMRQFEEGEPGSDREQHAHDDEDEEAP